MPFMIFRNGKALDLDAVTLPDGRRARSLSRDELENELVAMKVPGISAGQGKDSMVEIFSKHQAMWSEPKHEIR